MVPAEVSGLSLRFCDVFRFRNGNEWKDHGRAAWRIHIAAIDNFLPMPFVREKDAEIAIRSIAGFTDWNASKEELLAFFKDKNNRDQLRRLLVQNLAW